MNISSVPLLKTANTCNICAKQRAENIAALGARNTNELCVGPSFETLETNYNSFGIEFFGNDIDFRWRNFYPSNNWLMGDCTNLDLGKFDSVVFAPPLSKGCSGTRKHSLSIDDVFPSYTNFINLSNKITTLVLPARSLSTYKDKTQFHKLLNLLYTTTNKRIDVVPLYNKVRKYIDIYIYD